MNLPTRMSSDNVTDLRLTGCAIDRSGAKRELAAARARLANLARTVQCEKRSHDISAKYYGQRGQHEEIIEGLVRSQRCDAVVTRNHYGCVVMNAARAMFIDVDFAPPRMSNYRDAWQQTYD